MGTFLKTFIVVLLFLGMVSVIHSCQKDNPTLPFLTTTAVSGISQTTATTGGNVTNEGVAPILSLGVCWNTSANPTISNSKTIESICCEAFMSNITQLTFNTIYCAKIFYFDLYVFSSSLRLSKDKIKLFF